MAITAKRQQGFYLIALTAALAVIAFGFVTAYSSMLAKKEQKSLLDTQKTYMEQARTALESAYEQHIAEIESSSSNTSEYRTGEKLLSLAGITPKWGVQVAISNPMITGDLRYSILAMWLPSDTDAENPASFNPNTGEFVSCTNAAANCAPRASMLMSGLNVQKRLEARAIKQLNDLASAHQAYFKSKFLMDPDKNISINYFRAPENICTSTSAMPCIDTCIAEKDTTAVALLGLSPQQLTNPWGVLIETSNKVDCGGTGAALPTSYPYRMSFRSTTPWGSSYTIFALQPI